MNQKTISATELEAALNLRDLSDPRQGPHAMQNLLETISDALAERLRCRKVVYRSCPIVLVADNYDELGYSKEGVVRDARYTRYVAKNAVLRTHVTASIPTLLRALSHAPLEPTLLVCPGLAYRRDVIDRLHVGEPHQLDLWRLVSGKLNQIDLQEMVGTVVTSVLPRRAYRLTPTQHPYTIQGLQIDVEENGQWIEIGECGLADPELLSRCGLHASEVSGLAMGLGLDRILMLRKGIQDIRLLRLADPRIASQMLDLKPYQAVSNQPAILRDLSVCVAAEMDAEQIGDRVRSALGEQVNLLESLQILSETSLEDLPLPARTRLGICENQKNLLVRLVLRHPTQTLTAEEANRIRDTVYLQIHEGTKSDLTAG